MKRILELPWHWRWPILILMACAIAAAVGAGVAFGLAPHVRVDGRRLNWIEWITVVGFPVAVVGLGITWLEVLKAQTAAEAATEAVGRALTELGKSELLVDLGALRQLEYEFDRTEGADRETVQRLIRELREVGSKVSAALRKKDEADELIGKIEAVRKTAADARIAIMGGRKNMNLWKVTRKLREELVPLGDDVLMRMHELRMEVEVVSNVG